MDEELAFKCRDCDFVAYDADIFNLHRKEHGLPNSNLIDTLGKWSPPMVKLLIMLYTDNKNKYGNIHWTSRRIWSNIASAMCGMGYLVNPHQCSEKWRNLKKTYIKIRDTIGKTGSRRDKWEFYYEMEDALGENSNSSHTSLENSDCLKEACLTEDSTDQLLTTSAEAFNLPSELYQFKDQSSAASYQSPASPSYSGECSQEKCLKRKLPPLEWYDEYLEELRAARRDKNRRHQDKQIYRQQVLDLCKQMLIPSNNLIKTEMRS